MSYLTKKGTYYEGDKQLGDIDCQKRPDADHILKDDPLLTPMSCWRVKDQSEIDSEKDKEFIDHWKKDPANDTLILILYEIYILATGTNPTHKQFWNAIKDRFKDTNDNFFDF